MLGESKEGDGLQNMMWDEIAEIVAFENFAVGGDQGGEEAIARQLVSEFNQITRYKKFERLLPLVRVKHGLNQVFLRSFSDMAQDVLRCGYFYPDQRTRRLVAAELMLREGFYPLFLLLVGRMISLDIEKFIAGNEEDEEYDECDEPRSMDKAIGFLTEVIAEVRHILARENDWESGRVRVMRGGPLDQAFTFMVDGFGWGDIGRR